MSNDVIREFNVKCVLVTPEDKNQPSFITLQVPKGTTLAYQLNCLPDGIFSLVESYIHNDIVTMRSLKDSLKKITNKLQPANIADTSKLKD